jgi:hypothetical protein
MTKMYKYFAVYHNTAKLVVTDIERVVLTTLKQKLYKTCTNLNKLSDSGLTDTQVFGSSIE